MTDNNPNYARMPVSSNRVTVKSSYGLSLSVPGTLAPPSSAQSSETATTPASPNPHYGEMTAIKRSETASPPSKPPTTQTTTQQTTKPVNPSFRMSSMLQLSRRM